MSNFPAWPWLVHPYKKKGCRDKLADGLPWLLAGLVLGGGVCVLGWIVDLGWVSDGG